MGALVAVAGVTGALLAEDLLVVAADFSAGLGVGGTRTAVCLVSHDEVMHGLGALVTASELDVGGSGGF